MTEESPKTTNADGHENIDNNVDAIKDLRAEFQKQMEEFKLTVQKDMEAKDKKIAELEKINASLNSELVRKAFTTPSEQPKEKTKEELYQEEVDRNVELTKKYIKSMVG